MRLLWDFLKDDSGVIQTAEMVIILCIVVATAYAVLITLMPKVILGFQQVGKQLHISTKESTTPPYRGWSL